MTPMAILAMALMLNPPLPIRNGDFKQCAGGAAANWDAFGRYALLRNGGRHGRPALDLRCDGSTDAGAVQTIDFDPPRRGAFAVTAWMRCEGVNDEEGDCALWLDALQDGGPPIWGAQGLPDRRTPRWQQVRAEIRPLKPIKQLKIYLLLRKAKGEVRFSGIAAESIPVVIRDLRVYPVAGVSFEVRASLSEEAPWRMRAEQGGNEFWSAAGATSRLAEHLKAPGDGPVTIELTAERDGARARASAIARPRNQDRPFDWWVADSFSRVFQDDIPPRRTARGAVLDMACGERQSFQVCLRPAQRPLHHVYAAVSEMKSETNSLSGARIGWFRVGYVRVAHPYAHPYSPRRDASWWPDPLLPPTRFEAAPGATQPLWFTVDVPVEAVPGEYRGRVVLSADGIAPVSVPVAVRVHHVVVPRRGQMRTAFAFMDGYMEKLYGSISPPLRRAYTDYLLEHHLNPDDISRYETPDLDELSYANTRGLNAFNILNVVPEPERPVTWICFAPVEAYTLAFRKRFFERLDAIVPELRKRGLADKAYIYGFDERGPEYLPIIRDLFGEIRRRYPEVKTLSTCWPPSGTDPLSLNVDWFVPLSSRYDPTMARAVRQRGGQVWWYICLGPNYPYANWLLENPLIEARVIWWQAFQYDVEGFLYWGLNIWERGHNDLPIPDDAGPRLDWSVTTGGEYAQLNGDGELLYPGTRGPIGSIRLENIRDGLQDIELLRTYRERFGEVAAGRILRLITTDRTHYTRDPAVLLAARREILRQLGR